MYDCIERILGQIESLQKFFQSIDSRNYNTRVLRDMYSDTRNHVYLIFLAAVLHNVKTESVVSEPDSRPLEAFSRTGRSIHRCP